MAKIGLFYGSTTGSTQSVAERIQEALGGAEVDVANIATARPPDLERYEALIFGTPTWGVGELQDDWEAFERQWDTLDLTGKKVAFFGLGDQAGYPASFLDAMGILRKKAQSRGAMVVGSWPAVGYQHDDSVAERGGKFDGLALDEDNEPEKTEGRIRQWAAQIRQEFGV